MVRLEETSRAYPRTSRQTDLAREALESNSRRHTFTPSNPLSSVVTPSTVHAAHISNPIPGSPSSTLVNSTASHHSVSGPCSSSSYSELKRLTQGVSISSAKKNTPPQSPRSKSTERVPGKRTATSSPESSNLSNSGDGTVDGITAKVSETVVEPTGRNGASVGPPKGKLLVKISEGKGLRPSHDPYVVCVFEWNEYISRGPRFGDVDMDRDDEGAKDEAGGVAVRRTGSDMGKPIAIPMRSRQTSNQSSAEQKEFRSGKTLTDPRWDHEAVFDVVGERSEIDVSVYDRRDQENFLGHVRLCPLLTDENPTTQGWFELMPRGGGQEQVSGSIYLQMKFQKTDKRQYGPEDFQILKLIGKGKVILLHRSGSL